VIIITKEYYYGGTVALLLQDNLTKSQVICQSSQWTWQRNNITDWWLQQQLNGTAFCIRLTVSVSVLQDVIITSQVMALKTSKRTFSTSPSHFNTLPPMDCLMVTGLDRIYHASRFILVRFFL